MVWTSRKIENCQVGVFACLGHDEHVCLSDYRLFIPEAWSKDEARLSKAKVPGENRQYSSKHDQALGMITHAKELKLKFGWVGFDSLYGSKRELVNAVEDLGLSFVGDVHKTTKVWDAKPSLDEPVPLNGAGRSRKNYRLSASNQAKYCSVQSLTRECFESAHKRVCYRQGSKGESWTEIWGSSGENTDIIGHLMGLLSGLLLGFLFKRVRISLNNWVMGGVAVFSLAMIPIAWWFAIG